MSQNSETNQVTIDLTEHFKLDSCELKELEDGTCRLIAEKGISRLEILFFNFPPFSVYVSMIEDLLLDHVMTVSKTHTAKHLKEYEDDNNRRHKLFLKELSEKHNVEIPEDTVMFAIGGTK